MAETAAWQGQSPLGWRTLCRLRSWPTQRSRSNGSAWRRRRPVLVVLAMACGGGRALLLPPLQDSPPEAMCALSLLSRLLGQCEQPRLIVVGSVPWLDAVLRRLPVMSAAVTLLPYDDGLWRDAALQMSRENSLVMVVADTPSALVRSVPVSSLPYLVRTIMWAGLPERSPNTSMEAVRDLSWKCLFNAVLVLTNRKGITTVYRNPCKCGEHPPPAVEENQWDPERGWEHAGDPFARPCRQWQQPRDGVHRAWVNPFLFAGTIPLWSARRERELRHFVKYHGVPLQTSLMGKDEVNMFAHAVACRLDILATPLTLTPALQLVSFPWATKHMIAVVPAPHERRRDPLSALADEFDLTAWCTTYAAIFAVTAAMYLLRENGPLAAGCFETHMLSFPACTTALQRPVLGFWLITGLVLTTTYQGQLLSEINVKNTVGTIDSVEQLVASNLTLVMHNPYHASLFPLREWGLADRVRYTAHTGVTLTDVFDYVGVARNAAVLIRPGETELPPLVADIARIHTFQLPAEMYVTNYVVMQGSPFEVSFRQFLGRWRAAGLSSKFADRNATVTGLQTATKSAPLPTHLEPLRIKNARPMFRILLDGLVSAGAVLILEIFLPRTNRPPTRCPTR